MSEVDPRDARIAQLEGELAEVKQQLAKALATIAELRGKVLVVGGSHTSEAAELYDPETGTWSLTGVLRFARYGHTATLLPSGQVLVVGGTPWVGTATVEVRADLYDPDTGVWTAMRDTGSLRVRHRAVLLPSGQVLVVGTAYERYGPGMLYTP
ncbi:MAG TPA: kelch repeat-containing protein [Archangium sp.]|nr:kelch repeat-containing protein [Archangium sp.]